jgi:hypothetical protein
MTCDCRETIESKLLTRFREQVLDAQNHEASLEGYGFVLGASVREVSCMTIELTADRPLKRGGYKPKTDRMSMFFTFCPFCGKKYEKEAV